ncbi:AUGMIN subunit 6, partial [Sarracenia purpurea var. burkii]
MSSLSRELVFLILQFLEEEKFKESLKANDGEGPDLLRSAHDGSTSGHAESLTVTLTEHQQHLASIQ